jgi:serine/threonine protein kinase
MLLERQQIGHYRLIRLLGSGGMGEVYLAADKNIPRRVVIKVIRTDISFYSSDEEFKEAVRLFRREANAVAMLDHPLILPLFEYGEENFNGTTFTYLVMPYRPEGSLADLLLQPKRTKQFSPQDVAHFVLQASDALQHAHAHNIIHRDVKPSNFLLRKRNESSDRPDLLLADFGIAKLNTSTTPDSNTGGTILGTATYMAPEQWEDHPVPQSDQYALAVMAYELLTGRPPFLGHQQHLMYQHFYVQPKPPSAINPQIAQDIDTVLLRALAKNPADRFASISAFAHAFQQAVSHAEEIFSLANADIIEKTPPAIDPNNDVPFIKHQQPHLRAKSILLIAFVLLVIAGSFGLLYARNAQQEAIDQANAMGTAQKQHTAMAYSATGTAQFNASSTSQAYTTATVQTNARATATTQANAHATATTQANAYATATAQANAYATATAQASATAAVRAANPNLYPPYGGTLVLYDPLSDNSQGNSWDDGTTNCAFTKGAYHVIQRQKDLSVHCAAHNTNFNNFVYEAQMTIISGNCGALIFRADTANSKFYYFRVCQDGTYAFILYMDKTHTQTLKNASSSTITTGLNRPNQIAVVASGNNIDLYVNRQKIDGANDNTYSQGQIGVAAESYNNSTEVVYSNIKVWAF